MEQLLIELSPGEAVKIGQYLVTLLEVDGDTICVEVFGEDGEEVDASEFLTGLQR